MSGTLNVWKLGPGTELSAKYHCATLIVIFMADIEQNVCKSKQWRTAGFGTTCDTNSVLKPGKVDVHYLNCWAELRAPKSELVLRSTRKN